MNLFDVYSLFDLTPVKAEASYLWDDKGEKYLDLYGGHAVISVGHSHPHYVKTISEQLQNIGFYSNSVHIPIQDQVAKLLGKLSGYDDYQLFLCNSGAEANENAIKLASFHNGKKKVISFSKAFHGRTSAAVAATDDASIVAPVNETENILFVEFNNEEALEKAFAENEISSVIIEGIQGVGGVLIPTDSFLQKIEKLCKAHNALFILDEIQSGYGRTGKFFAHQFSGVKPDIITTAKGMGNGFPVAGVLISPDIKPKKGMLGTTFGGNYLACAASLAVLEILEKENLIQNAQEMGDYLVEQIKDLPKIKEIRSVGLMVGIELEMPCAEVRNNLLLKHKMLTGNASNKNTLRVLPSLTVSKVEIDQFVNALKTELNG
ncbi:aminotransferase class III-fold pyridoxal phosphate-dependent enzyme [Elizabethkingia meningoseptica]|uniref:aspartate aminotransferase family protein n=1 Tax=Elizabethkingia meningoseptica TaxID=238 RepID=UPI000332C010|nr:aminotransferase class III-fold pyridoxal phosphate-dependent enzyme [Elizabethkingia meningoseptica]AQX04540.1 acetylornithine aminotransferase [Elizabethkingia meningoseptica]AQX46583.1 acetylornithine aminotransferase [Elizabethkingia meningoseptica]EJK5328518.1 aminotransferase class III-fold pyridoxal phosphate-dependent enzyme [Elizabethkingia meningoseptica]EOR31455.1 acetylornithine aminotransferase [Elizabethkingia meningoseptica ATCC 13253 = NBRC 12535]KUY19097.1 acetylornithine a